MVQHILVALDGSAPSRHAARFAFSLARQTKAQVTLLTVLPPPEVVPPVLPPLTTESLSVRERVSPLETYFDDPPEGLPSSTPRPSASKPPSLGSTWARSNRDM